MRSPMRKALAIMTITALSASISGCGWILGDDGMFRDRGNDYRRAQLEPVMQVPKGMNTETIVDEFAIPKNQADAIPLSAEFTTPRPPKLSTVPDAVRLNKLGDKNWILADASPAELWAQVRGFLNVSKIPVARADALSGQIDTEWLQPTITTQLEERFQFVVDQGVQRGTAEVRVLMMKKGQNNDDVWPEKSVDPAREAVMLRELSQYLADASSTGAVSMLAQRGIDDSGRIFFESSVGGSDPSLKLQLPFYRAWASLGSALTRGQFAVVSSDEATKTYLVKALPETEEVVEEKYNAWWVPDFIEEPWDNWTWQAPWAADQVDEVEAQEPSSVTVEDVPSWWNFSGENTSDFPLVKVTLAMDAKGLTGIIRVADKQGKPLNADEASALLVRIKNYLR